MRDPRSLVLLACLVVPCLLAMAPPASDIEAWSYLGRPLERPELPPDARADFEAKLARARADHAASPDSEDAWIWLGRRTAYLGRYREAIAIYTEAMDAIGETPRLLRHRGHRFLTLRRPDLARRDLERAATLIEGTADRVEADGLPNAAGIPTSTLHTNVFYHLGLARYLQADWSGAASAFGRCLAIAGNDDMRVAATYWTALSLRRAGERERARALVVAVGPDVTVIENEDYLRLARALAGDAEVREAIRARLAEAEATGDVAGSTLAYGWSHVLEWGGQVERALELRRRLVTDGAWAAFGAMAAEADVARATRSPHGGPSTR